MSLSENTFYNAQSIYACVGFCVPVRNKDQIKCSAVIISTCNSHITHSASAMCCLGDGLESRPHTESEPKKLQWLLLQLCLDIRAEGLPWLKTGATHYHAQLGHFNHKIFRITRNKYNDTHDRLL